MSWFAFEKCLNVAWQPVNDGQPFHVTMGDPGGATRMGVLFRNFVAWRIHRGAATPSVMDFQNASLDELTDLIHAWYWMAVAGDRMPVGLDLLLFEIGFGSGQGWAARLLKRAMRRPENFVMDAAIVWAAQHVNDIAGLIGELTVVHKAFVDSLPGASEFQRGWDRRIQTDQKTALSWLPPVYTQHGVEA